MIASNNHNLIASNNVHFRQGLQTDPMATTFMLDLKHPTNSHSLHKPLVAAILVHKWTSNSSSTEWCTNSLTKFCKQGGSTAVSTQPKYLLLCIEASFKCYLWAQLCIPKYQNVT